MRAAASPKKTVIITTLNEAWAAPNSVLDLFLHSFKSGDVTRKILNHLVTGARACIGIYMDYGKKTLKYDFTHLPPA